ncbi:MAG: ATP-grasp domain-containing protein [Ignavibacteriales bacterium]|nr:ATP-grasp domain-containing protein [Ignavibacteriales bacterium]
MKIAVTGLNATDNPGPGIPVMRSLQEGGFEDLKLIGLIYDSLEPGIYMDNAADVCYQIPYPSSGLDSLYERIAHIHSIEKIDMLIPTLDSELYGFVKLESRLNALGIKTFLPTLDQLNIRGKDKLLGFCKANGIHVPKNTLATSIQDLYSIPSDFTYPVVIKGIFYEAYIANNFEEAAGFFKKLANKWGYPIIIQEYIKGSEYNVVALGDGEGGMTGAVPMKKLYITDKGKGWSGVTITEPALLEISQKVISKISWKSGMELEFMKSETTGEYYLLEINPRFPAWVYLAPGAGQNLPAAMVKMAFGEKIKPFDHYTIGKMFVRCSWDLLADVSKLAQISTLGVLENGK